MMPGDGVELGEQAAKTFEGLPLVHYWDADRQLGNLYARTLHLNAVAWDVYLLYAPGIKWEGTEPPQPTFWMHQLPSDTGADPDLVLYPTKLLQELSALIDGGLESNNAGQSDLGLQLHVKGLFNLLGKGSQYTVDDVQQAVEDSKSRE